MDDGIALDRVAASVGDAGRERSGLFLGRPAGQIKMVVEALGKELDGPWRAEEKTAATAAWMVLSRR